MDLKESKAYVSTGIVALNAIIFLICTFTGNLLYNIGEISPQLFLKAVSITGYLHPCFCMRILSTLPAI